MEKKIVRLNESQLRNMIVESVKNIISERNGWAQTLNFEQALYILNEKNYQRRIKMYRA